MSSANWNDPIRSERITLDRLRFATTNRISDSVLRDIKVDVVADFLMGGAVARLEAMVLAERLVGDTATATFTMPASWFQHLKRDVWFVNLDKDRIMRWASRRWPVKTKTYPVSVVFQRYALFPRSTLEVPSLGAPVIFEQFSEPRWDE